MTCRCSTGFNCRQGRDCPHRGPINPLIVAVLVALGLIVWGMA